jgi:hypothetical protein
MGYEACGFKLQTSHFKLAPCETKPIGQGPGIRGQAWNCTNKANLVGGAPAIADFGPGSVSRVT